MQSPVTERPLSEVLRESEQIREELAQNMERLRQTLQNSRMLLNGGQPPRPEPSVAKSTVTLGMLDPLTPREVEVLRLIAEGHSTKEIADRLNIRFKTAVCHRSRILQKLGVHETVSLVRMAIRAGLLEA